MALVAAALRMRRAREIVTAHAKEREALATRLEDTRLLDIADPVVFAEEVLGVKVWSKQADLLHTVQRCARTAVRAGHKVSKSNSFAILALWWWKTRDRARVVMTGPGARQVRGIFWPEVRHLYHHSRRPLGGRLFQTPENGLRAEDGREIVGFSTNAAEKIAGWSGINVLFLIDEASGVNELIFDAIEGNRAGAGAAAEAKVVLGGNPTRVSGKFYSVFTSERAQWERVHISSEDSPNVTGEALVPGLASPEWIADRREAWGPDYKQDPRYQVRVLGEFPTQSINTVVSLGLIEDANTRYEDTQPTGVLHVGVDVARFGDDETVIQPRRGEKALPATALRSQDTIEIAGRVRAMIFGHGDDRGLVRRTPTGQPSERPQVKVDVIGVGAGVYDQLAKSALKYGDLDVIPINVAESPTVKAGNGEPEYYQLRDQLWFACRDWLRRGGALPPDPKLEADLIAPTFTYVSHDTIKVESKESMKKRLGRSPDRADALALSIYSPPPKPKPTAGKVNLRRR